MLQPNQRSIVQEIRAALDSLSTLPMAIHICKRCSSKMVNVDATLLLADTECQWNVLLPVCPKCDRQEYLQLISGSAA